MVAKFLPSAPVTTLGMRAAIAHMTLACFSLLVAVSRTGSSASGPSRGLVGGDGRGEKRLEPGGTHVSAMPVTQTIMISTSVSLPPAAIPQGFLSFDSSSPDVAGNAPPAVAQATARRGRLVVRLGFSRTFRVMEFFGFWKVVRRVVWALFLLIPGSPDAGSRCCKGRAGVDLAGLVP